MRTRHPRFLPHIIGLRFGAALIKSAAHAYSIMSKVTDADAKLAFMKEGLMALGATAGVLRRYNRSPAQAHPLDFGAFAGALRSVCQTEARDERGVDDLDVLVGVFAAYHDAVRAGIQLDAAEFRRGLDSVRCYRTWLSSVFCKE